jgi:cation:H+ antiporter
MNNKKITTLFTAACVLLIGASVGTTYVCDAIIKNLNMDTAFGGSIFVSISTALPEIISCLTLFRLKNPNAAVSNMIGSNVFNIFTLFVNDLITSVIKPPQALFQPD